MNRSWWTTKEDTNGKTNENPYDLEQMNDPDVKVNIQAKLDCGFVLFLLLENIDTDLVKFIGKMNKTALEHLGKKKRREQQRI